MTISWVARLLEAERAATKLTLIALSGLGLFVLAVAALMAPYANIVGNENLSQLVCLQLGFTPERSAGLVLGFPLNAQQAIRGLLVPGDMTLAWGYGLVLAGLGGLVALRLPSERRVLAGLLIILPLGASLFDSIENVFLFAIVGELLAQPELALNPALPFLAGVAATVKWSLLAVATPVAGLWALGLAFVADRKPVSLLVYVLFFIVLLSMVIKPIQDIPSCF